MIALHALYVLGSVVAIGHAAVAGRHWIAWLRAMAAYRGARVAHATKSWLGLCGCESCALGRARKKAARIGALVFEDLPKDSYFRRTPNAEMVEFKTWWGYGARSFDPKRPDPRAEGYTPLWTGRIEDKCAPVYPCDAPKTDAQASSIAALEKESSPA